MNTSYDQQIFGQLIIPQPSTQKIYKPKIATNPKSTSSYSFVNYSNSSYESDKNRKKNRGYCLIEKANPWKALSSSYQNSCKSQILDSKKTIENCSTTIQQTKQNSKSQVNQYQCDLKKKLREIEQIGRNKLSKSNNFYCSCNQISQQSKLQNKNCRACGGAGFVNGTSNQVKFMEYIMEFKLGLKDSYINNTLLQSTSQKQSSNNQTKKIPTTEEYLQGYNIQELLLNKNFECQPLKQERQKKIKKTVKLSNKSTVLNPNSEKSINSQGSKTRINQFCSDFIMSRDRNQSNLYKNMPVIQSSFVQSQLFINNISNYSQNQNPTACKNKYQPQTKDTININESNSSQGNSQLYFQYGRLSQSANLSGIHLGLNAMTQSIIDEPRDSLSGSPSPDKSQEMKQNIDMQKIDDREQIPFDKLNYNKKKTAIISNSDNKTERSSININESINPVKSSCYQQPKTKSMLINISKSSLGVNQAQNPRQSLPNQKFMDFNELKYKFSLQNSIHTGYECDNCSVNPIIGLRYHCNSFLCEDDYDLCQKCYKNVGHKHCMQQFRVNKNTQKIFEGLSQLNNSSSISRLANSGINIEPLQADLYKLAKEKEYFNYEINNKSIYKSSIH